ncbi:uncharacterized protein LOC123538902 isoform X2 [Mercenaria mercenaria]|uniref:uncharacterized protein LOC123538902 isoform X2 n=1 Tax=Mercenaria mercenaria TaxID=6596 RepID=UPI00234EAD33|nr:uncharacterized protein LOC123538902 isoform X2 [Mercenaria mercenaria]
MDERDVEVFIETLKLQLNVYSFDYLASIPMPFSDLAKVNRVSESFRSLQLPAGYGKPLKNILKPLQGKEGVNMVKRKLESSCDQGVSAAKSMKAETAVENKLEAIGIEKEQVSEYITFDDNKMKEALKHLNSFLEEDNIERLKKVLQQSRDEGELEVGLGIHLFSMLMGEAYTSKKKSLRSCPCGCQEKLLENENMWIGSENTWYGELDIIAGNPVSGEVVSVFVETNTESGSKCDETKIGKDDVVSFQGEVTEEEENEDEATDLNDSPGDRTNLEVKYCGPSQALNQVIAQAIVFAFTEYNRHPSKSKFIPSVLIDKARYQYVIYSPVDDILLVSNYMVYINDENFDKKSGYRPFVVLWLILNHRLFFTKCPFRRIVRSGFHKNIKNLQQFQNLTEYSKIIHIEQNSDFPNDTPNAIDDRGMEWFVGNQELCF